MSFKPFFPLTISSSLLESWNTCNQKGYRQFFQHLDSGRTSVHLVAGGAYAKGLEVARKAYYIDGEHPIIAQELGREALVEAYGDFVPYLGDDDKKSLSSVEGLYAEYFEAYPFDLDMVIPVTLEDGRKAVEFPFSIELPLLHPDLGVPLHFVGRFDMLVEYLGGLWGFDDKTKGGYPSRDNKKVLSEWATRGQFTGYSWAMKELGVTLRGFIIREAYFQSKSTWAIREVQTTRGKVQVELWGKQMHKQVAQMIEQYKLVQSGADARETYIMASHAGACNGYATACPFMEICTGDLTEQYLEDRFEQSIWIPEETRRVSLDEYINSITGEAL